MHDPKDPCHAEAERRHFRAILRNAYTDAELAALTLAAIGLAPTESIPTP